MQQYSQEEIKQLLLKKDKDLLEHIDHIHPMDFLEIIHDISDDEQVNFLLNNLPDDYLAALLDFEEDEEKYELLKHFSDQRQKNILSEMSSDEIVDLVESLEDKEKYDVLKNIDKEDIAEIHSLLSYAEDSAGSIMTTEFISIWDNKTVLDTLKYLQEEAKDAEMAYYLYVTDKQSHLKGVLSLRDIITNPFDTLIQEIINPNVHYVHVNDDQEEVARIFDKYDYISIPVVDDDKRIVGIITVDDIIDIIKEETTEDIHLMAGLDGEEKVDGSLIDSIRSRLPWLIINLITAILAASVVALFSDTIEAIVALAAINPIIAGMGGNAGTQSLTIIVRGIALNELTKENALPIFYKEFGVGLITGAIIGLITGIGCYFFYGSFVLGFVVFFAMVCNLIIATISGYSVPLILKKLNIDPALASSIFVTTATDVLGFFIFLGLATICLPYLM